MNNNRGVALAVSLISMVMITTLSTGLVMTAIQEKKSSDLEVSGAKALYATESGGNVGLAMLNNLINVKMSATVGGLDPTVVATQVNNYKTWDDGIGLLLAYVKDGGTALLTQDDSSLVYTGAAAALDDSHGALSTETNYTIRITRKSKPTSSQATATMATIWKFPFYYTIQSTGTNGSQSRKMSLSGDFTVCVHKKNFARYALFTSSQTTQSGSNVWFTSTARFKGPIFTNGQYNFAYNPGGRFEGLVEQHETQARFYNNNHPVLLDADANGSIDVPLFEKGFTRGVPTITMPTGTDETVVAKEAAGVSSSGSIPYSSNGIYLPVAGTALQGGIYVHGNTAIDLSMDGSDRQVITITPSVGAAKTVTLDRTAGQTLVQSGGITTTYSGLPDGYSNGGSVIYVQGEVTALAGTVQSDNQMMISSRNDLVITNNIRYQDYTTASGTVGTEGYVPPSAEGYQNLLGLVTWQGNARISTAAPTNLDIHAVIMAKQGVVTVDDYDDIAPRGYVTVLGGVISNNYGAFGTFNSSTGAMVSGYTRNFSYDTRMEEQMTPPYFPTIDAYMVSSTDIDDKQVWQQGGF